MSSNAVTFLDSAEKIVTRGGSIVMRVLGPILVLGLYAIVALHVYAFFTVVTPLLKNRIGTELGMLWIIVGLSLVYNIVFNHFMAVILKPGGPIETRETEKVRQAQKQRSHRKEVNFDDASTDSYHEGLSAEVKALLRYRSKTMS